MFPTWRQVFFGCNVATLKKNLPFALLSKKKALFLQRQRKGNKMKYNELERLLKKIGCYDTGKTCNGHPLWYSPKTGKQFKMSHHKHEEVATGTLKSIKKDSGLE